MPWGCKALSQVCDNAMKLYFSTRPQPSSRAIKAQKTLAWEAIHPDLLSYGPKSHLRRDSATSAPGLRRYEGDDELFRSEYVSSLKAFRPTQVGVFRRPAPSAFAGRPSPVGRHESAQRAPAV